MSCIGESNGVPGLGGLAIFSFVGFVAAAQSPAQELGQGINVSVEHDTIRVSPAHMGETHALCNEHGDVFSASFPETWIDEAERRTCFVFEASRHG